MSSDNKEQIKIELLLSKELVNRISRYSVNWNQVFTDILTSYLDLKERAEVFERIMPALKQFSNPKDEAIIMPAGTSGNIKFREQPQSAESPAENTGAVLDVRQGNTDVASAGLQYPKIPDEVLEKYRKPAEKPRK